MWSPATWEWCPRRPLFSNWPLDVRRCLRLWKLRSLLLIVGHQVKRSCHKVFPQLPPRHLRTNSSMPHNPHYLSLHQKLSAPFLTSALTLPLLSFETHCLLSTNSITFSSLNIPSTRQNPEIWRKQGLTWILRLKLINIVFPVFHQGEVDYTLRFKPSVQPV